MLMNFRSAHGIHVSEYKKKFNITSDKDYDLVELILHECGICGLYLLLDSDVIAVHIKRHKITHANYNAKFMSLVSPLQWPLKFFLKQIILFSYEF